jgi:plastocyanin
MRSSLAWSLVAVVAGACAAPEHHHEEEQQEQHTPPPSGVKVSVTITSAGLSNANLEVAVGTEVTFKNEDSVAHQPASAPHPSHTSCPELNSTLLNPGGTFRFVVQRSCSYHDHLDALNETFHGEVTIPGDPPETGYP